MIKRTRQQKIFYYSMPRLYNLKIQELDQCIDKVAWLLKNFSKTRNSDKLLIFYYWIQNDGFKGQLDSDFIKKLTPAESITRARRKLQELAQENPIQLEYLLPDDLDVINGRTQSEKGVRDWAIDTKLGV